MLPNGNVLVSWGSESAIIAFESDVTPIFHCYIDSRVLSEGVENYRGFRYNQTSIPNEAPALVALKDEEKDTTKIYVPWNGDTETKIWRFYKVLAGVGVHTWVSRIVRASRLCWSLTMPVSRTSSLKLFR